MISACLPSFCNVGSEISARPGPGCSCRVPEEAQHGHRREPAAARDRVDDLPVVHDHRVELAREASRRPADDQPPPRHQPTLPIRGASAYLSRYVVCLLEIRPCRVRIARRRGHQRPGACSGVSARRAAVEIDCERHIAFAREPSSHRLDVVVQSPPLVDHDDARQRLGRIGRHREKADQVALLRLAIRDLLLEHGPRGSVSAGGRRAVGASMTRLRFAAASYAWVNRARAIREGRQAREQATRRGDEAIRQCMRFMAGFSSAELQHKHPRRWQGTAR